MGVVRGVPTGYVYALCLVRRNIAPGGGRLQWDTAPPPSVGVCDPRPWRSPFPARPPPLPRTNAVYTCPVTCRWCALARCGFLHPQPGHFLVRGTGQRNRGAGCTSTPSLCGRRASCYCWRPVSQQLGSLLSLPWCRCHAPWGGKPCGSQAGVAWRRHLGLIAPQEVWGYLLAKAS